VTENHGVGGSIPPLGTTPSLTKSYDKQLKINLLSTTQARSGLAVSTLRYPPTFRLLLADTLVESSPGTGHPPAGDAAAAKIEEAMRDKITKRTVEAIEPSLRDTILWDTEIPGFGCKLTPKGARIYVLQYSQRGRDHRVTIGRHAPNSPSNKLRTRHGACAARSLGRKPCVIAIPRAINSDGRRAGSAVS
jgi:hypothetical protein